jgi:REP element-mobilizing transposase RayT
VEENMARQARKQSSSGYFHVIVRGIGRMLLFEEPSDYQYYLMLLERYSSDTSVSVCAYCMMENHVHLLVHDNADSLALFMKKMGVSYSMYFNKKYDRSGHLFQDRYLSEAVQDDSYFLTVFRYILLNPQAAGLCNYSEYPWSSFKLYGKKSSFVDTSLLVDMLGSFEQYCAFLDENCDDDCLDHDSAKISDDRAKEILVKKLGIPNGIALQSFDKPSRDNAIKTLRKAGLSERQIERLTGISRRVIHSILW